MFNIHYYSKKSNCNTFSTTLKNNLKDILIAFLGKSDYHAIINEIC